MIDIFATYREACALHAIQPQFDRNTYAAIETARADLCRALGYSRVHDHLGEYCNLHERDIPAARKPVTVSPMFADKSRPDAVYSLNGFCKPITKAEVAETLARHEARSAELERWFMTPADDRFIAGHPIVYSGLAREGEQPKCYMARYVKAGADAVPYLDVLAIEDTFRRRKAMQPTMWESEARAFFANVGEYTFALARFDAI